MTPFRSELIRKSIHLSSLWMPLVMYWLPQGPTIALFAVLALTALAVEHLRRRKPQINALFKGILRDHEQGETHNHTGSTWMLMGALFASLFPDYIAVTAMSILAVSDTFASLVGMRFGRHKILGKSLEGSTAFFLSGLIVIFALDHLFLNAHYLLIAILALAITTIGELTSTRFKMDDNLSVPVLMCILMLTFAVLFPTRAYAADFSAEIPTAQEHQRDLAPAKKPADYDAHASVKGDLDGDGKDEQVLIVQSTPGYPQQSILIFKGDDLWKIGATHVIEDSEGMLDPHGIVDLNIKNKVLTLATGPWGASCTQKWRAEKDSLRLIGLTRIEMSRNCACGTIVDTNYVTGESILTSDRGPDGTQLDQEIIRHTKKTLPITMWEEFSYKKFCAQ